MQSDMNIPNKSLSFEEDAFCKFYTSHANDKSSELREKISKNLSVLTNNNINDLEFTDAGDIKLRERDITPVKDQGDQSTRFQKNAKDIEKFIKFIGDFKGIINKEDAVIIKNQLMTNVSNPFLDPSVKIPLMNAWNVIQENFIDVSEPTEVEVADFKNLLQSKKNEASLATTFKEKAEGTENKNLLQFKNFLSDKTEKIGKELNKTKELLESKSELIKENLAKIDKIGVPLMSIGIALTIVGVATLVAVAVTGAVTMSMTTYLILLSSLGLGPLLLFGLPAGIVALVYWLKTADIQKDVDSAKSSIDKLERDAQAVNLINEKVNKNPSEFNEFLNKYEIFSLDEMLNQRPISFLNLYTSSISIDKSAKTLEKITDLEQKLGLKRRL